MSITKFVVMLSVLFFSQSGTADVSCQTDSEGYRVCNGDGFKQVVIRKMPSWNGQASLMMMDICRLPSHFDRELPEEGYEMSYGALEFPEGTVCQRQYCSEDHNWFSLSLDTLALLLPEISILEIELAITFASENFRLRCEQY